ncbi:MAG TPA: rRNA adenine N-6-methyltransferase family protein [Pyrinomonadaceae bacterium]|nr:rRNA adenine N-6-methyltransferase family protein [Pyrinomonadaceae bacterium]
MDRVKGNVRFASIKEIIEPSPLRVEPPCPYFGRCGGCDFQQLNYQAQLDAKTEIIKDCLRRIGRLESIPHFELIPAPNEWYYRSRAQWQFDSIRKRLGYFESGSHRVCDVAECAVLAPDLETGLERVRARMQQNALPDDARHFRAIVGDAEVSIVDDRGRSPVHDITRTINGERYHLNAASFFQANTDLLPQLIDAALGDVRGQTAVELYCGVGLFTVPLARRFEKVVAVEGDAAASDFGRRNLAEADLPNADIVNKDVANWLESLECAGLDGALDFLLLDPPRTGAESRVISGILRLKPKKISYVSCDPATLARDLRKLIAGDYSVVSISAFDMFPQTHHVETVVQLARR